MSYFQITIIGFSFSVSKPFKKPFYTNIILTVFMILVLSYNYLLILFPDNNSLKFLDVRKFKNYLDGKISFHES